MTINVSMMATSMTIIPPLVSPECRPLFRPFLPWPNVAIGVKFRFHQSCGAFAEATDDERALRVAGHAKRTLDVDLVDRTGHEWPEASLGEMCIRDRVCFWQAWKRRRDTDALRWRAVAISALAVPLLVGIGKRLSPCLLYTSRCV